MMDRGLYEAPNLPLPRPFLVKIMCLESMHFQQYLRGYFGDQFATHVMSSPVSVVLPVVTYGQEWDITIFVLY